MNFCNDFSHDLEFGQVGEGILAEILTNKKVEVKRDNWVEKTGNIAIEFESRGKPSGISVTKADYWVILFDNDRKFIGMQTDYLKELARIHYKKGRVKAMGDDNTSSAVLIPIAELC